MDASSTAGTGDVSADGKTIDVTINAGWTASGIVVKGGPRYNKYVGPFPGLVTLDDLEPRLSLALLHYVWLRPHEGLGGATPAEAFLGAAPACHKAVEPPRGRLGEGSLAAPFHIEHLDPANRRYPILTPAA